MFESQGSGGEQREQFPGRAQNGGRSADIRRWSSPCPTCLSSRDGFAVAAEVCVCPATRSFPECFLEWTVSESLSRFPHPVSTERWLLGNTAPRTHSEGRGGGRPGLWAEGGIVIPQAAVVRGRPRHPWIVTGSMLQTGWKKGPLFPPGSIGTVAQRGAWGLSLGVFMAVWIGHGRKDIPGGKCGEEATATAGRVFVETLGCEADCVTDACHGSRGHGKVRVMRRRDGRAQ